MKMQSATNENNLLKLEKIVKEKNLYKAFFDNDTNIIIDENDILAYALYKDAKVELTIYDKLKDKESYYLCLQDALKMVNYKAYSIKQVKDKLKLKQHRHHDIDHVINYLDEHHILDDNLFKESYINLKVMQGYGPLYIKRKLYEKGIDEMIDIDTKVLQDRLYKYFIAMYNNQETRSYARTKFINKMVNKGYAQSMIEAVFDEQDMLYNNEQLKREYQKLYDKLKIKYHDYELSNQIKNRLMRKGYSYSEVNEVVREDD